MICRIFLVSLVILMLINTSSLAVEEWVIALEQSTQEPEGVFYQELKNSKMFLYLSLNLAEVLKEKPQELEKTKDSPLTENNTLLGVLPTLSEDLPDAVVASANLTLCDDCASDPPGLEIEIISSSQIKKEVSLRQLEERRELNLSRLEPKQVLTSSFKEEARAIPIHKEIIQTNSSPQEQKISAQELVKTIVGKKPWKP